MARNKNIKGAGTQVVMQSLVVRPAKIESADINAWKSAVNNAKKGNRAKLYDLYENILADGVLSDAVDKRVGAITNAEIAFLRDGKNVEAIDDLIDTPEFEELIKEIVLHKAWGKSVIEVSFDPEFDIFSFPRKNIKLLNLDKSLSERKRLIVAKDSEQTGYDYSQDEYIIECGKDDDLGFLFKAAPYVIYKRGGFGDWAEFAEVFGMPFVTVKYPGFDTATRDAVFAAMEEAGGRPRIAVPKEAEIEMKEANSSGSNTLFKDLKNACNEEILISVLGNTMTTISGSSRSQGEVHENTQQGITDADRRYVQRVLNRRLVPLLLKRGYDVAGGFFSFVHKGQKPSTTELLDVAIKLKNEAKVPVSDDYFYEITGVPKAEASDPKPDKGKKAEKEPETDPEPDDKLRDPQPKPQRKGLSGFFAKAPVK